MHSQIYCQWHDEPVVRGHMLGFCTNKGSVINRPPPLHVSFTACTNPLNEPSYCFKTNLLMKSTNHKLDHHNCFLWASNGSLWRPTLIHTIEHHTSHVQITEMSVGYNCMPFSFQYLLFKQSYKEQGELVCLAVGYRFLHLCAHRPFCFRQ